MNVSERFLCNMIWKMYFICVRVSRKSIYLLNNGLDNENEFVAMPRNGKSKYTYIEVIE